MHDTVLEARQLKKKHTISKLSYIRLVSVQQDVCTCPIFLKYLDVSKCCTFKNKF